MKNKIAILMGLINLIKDYLYRFLQKNQYNNQKTEIRTITAQITLYLPD